MLLKSLALENFRQFIHAEVAFSTDKERNVTVIRGDNGAGKTAFAQAFTWCLYGDTSFVDKSMLNKIVVSRMTPNQEETVRVCLTLMHNGTEYSVIRQQVYKMSGNGSLRPNNSVLSVAYKKDGQQEFVKPLECELRIKQILPKELSRYFFFDGERIENMSREIQRGRSQTFAEAVQGLLGLSAYQDAMRDLKPTTQNSVIGLLNKDYDAQSDDKITKYTQQIEQYQRRLDKIEERLNEIETERILASERCEVLKEKIRLNADGDRLQKEKENLLRKIEAIKNSQKTALEVMLRQFNVQGASYFSRVMMRDAINILKTADFTNKDIPEINADTINFILEHQKCICGTKVKIGNDAYKNLVKLFSHVPPESIGMLVGSFINDTEQRAKISTELYESMVREYGLIRNGDGEIGEYDGEIHIIENKLSTMEKTAQFQYELVGLEQQIRSWKKESDGLLEDKGSIETSKHRMETERTELTLRDENNRKIEIYKAYAQYMYDVVSAEYEKKENATRNELESAINDIFKNIYNGGISLSIDERYNIQVTVDNYSGENAQAETSTAQSISVIFAFITGIIKLARASGEETELVTSEPYPLVMDAPLSAFDKRRIKTVCDTIPNIAEQVIIFIKDTDGELADEFLGQKVGSRYTFIKENEFLSVIK
ncbi:MAG: AAA family ATPase [Peptococcaceae bacterium]